MLAKPLKASTPNDASHTLFDLTTCVPVLGNAEFFPSVDFGVTSFGVVLSALRPKSVATNVLLSPDWSFTGTDILPGVINEVAGLTLPAPSVAVGLVLIQHLLCQVRLY